MAPCWRVTAAAAVAAALVASAACGAEAAGCVRRLSPAARRAAMAEAGPDSGWALAEYYRVGGEESDSDPLADMSDAGGLAVGVLPRGVGGDGGRAAGRALASWIGEECSRSMDLLFVLDESGSVGLPAWVNTTKFLVDAADAFDIGYNRTRVGVVKFSTGATLSIPLLTTTDFCAFRTKALALPYNGGSTNTPLGITTGTSELLAHGRPKSMAYPRVMIVVTDGQSNMPCARPCSTVKTIAAANEARAAGINVLILTIGPPANFNPGEVDGIAGGDASLKFALASYKELLGTIINSIATIACKQPTIMDLTTVVNTTVVGNTSVYLAYMNVSGPLDLAANVSLGDLNLCFSYTNKNPSSAPGQNDGCAVPDPATGNSTKIITAYPSAASNYTVYVVCEGAGVNDTVSQFAFGVLPCQMKTLAPSASASSLPQSRPSCYSCPADQVMLASSGPYAGVCAAACLSERQWTWPVGRRLCQDCVASCKTCGPAGSGRDCTTCSPASATIPYLLLNTLDPAADPNYDWVPGSGLCVGTCPSNLTLVPNPVNTTTQMCGTPIPSPTATPTSSISPGASVSHTPTVTPTRTMTRSVPPSASWTPTRSSSNSATPSTTASATLSPSPTATLTATASLSASATQSASGTLTATTTGTGSPTATGTTSATLTATSSESGTLTGTGTSTVTMSATATLTASPTPTATITLSATPTGTPSETASGTGTPTPSVTPLPVSNKCKPSNCNGHGTCREDPVLPNTGLCFCDFPYDGPGCAACTGGYFLNTTCTSCVPNIPGPCKAVSGNVCSPYASYTNEGVCGAGTKLCDKGSGKYKGATMCAPCPGLITLPDGTLTPCNNHGACEASGLCTCDQGWMGADCGTIDPSFNSEPCTGVDCSGNGICVGGSCICNTGWTGGDCSAPSGARRRRRAADAAATASEAGEALHTDATAVTTGDAVEEGGSGSGRNLQASGSRAQSYAWHVTPWSRCDVYCADPADAATAHGGNMTRTVSCRPVIPATGVFDRDAMIAAWDAVTLTYTSTATPGSPGAAPRQFILHPYVVVDDAFCAAAQQPAAAAACNTHYCIADGVPVIVTLNFGLWLSGSMLESQSPTRPAFLAAIHREACALLNLTATTTPPCDAVIPPHSVQVDLTNGTSVVLQINPEASIGAHGAPPAARVLQSGLAPGARSATDLAEALVTAVANPPTALPTATWLRRTGGYASYADYLAATAGADAGAAIPIQGAAAVASFMMTPDAMVGATADLVFATDALYVPVGSAPGSPASGPSAAAIGGGVAAAAVVVGTLLAVVVYRRHTAAAQKGKSSSAVTMVHVRRGSVNGGRRAISLPPSGESKLGPHEVWGVANPMAAVASPRPAGGSKLPPRSRVSAQLGDDMDDDNSSITTPSGAAASTARLATHTRRLSNARLGFSPSMGPGALAAAAAAAAAAAGGAAPDGAGKSGGGGNRSLSARAARNRVGAPPVVVSAMASSLAGYAAPARAKVSSGRPGSGRASIAMLATAAGSSARSLAGAATGGSGRSLQASPTSAGGGSNRRLPVTPTSAGAAAGGGGRGAADSPARGSRRSIGAFFGGAGPAVVGKPIPLARATQLGSSRRIIEVGGAPSPTAAGLRRSPSPAVMPPARRTSMMAVDMTATPAPRS